jgi:hypothetical protein
MKSIWTPIHDLCQPVRLVPRFDKVFVSRDPGQPKHWLIGPYSDLAQIRDGLGTEKSLLTALHDRGIRVGFRKTDEPPAEGVERQKSYGAEVPGSTASHAGERKTQLHLPVPGLFVPTHRISDESLNKGSYWQTQRPQVHHIVEFNNLRQLGVSTREGEGELDYDQLPCVMLMAEFHQRYISSVLKETHNYTGSGEALLEQYQTIYEELYFKTPKIGDDSRPFQALGEVAEVIFEEAAANLGDE